jgi:pantothenate kinase-related protein Tda10
MNAETKNTNDVQSEWNPMIITVKGPVRCGKSTVTHALTLMLDGLQKTYKVLGDVSADGIDRQIWLIREAYKKTGKTPPQIIIIDGVLPCRKKRIDGD